MFFDNSTSGLWKSDFLKVETPAPWHFESCIEDQTFVSWKLRPWGAVRQTDLEKDFMLFRRRGDKYDKYSIAHISSVLQLDMHHPYMQSFT